MMKLKNLVCNTDQAAKEFLKNWKHDDNSLRFWRGSSNYVYFFTMDNEKYWLRFSKKDENSLKQIEAEIEFLLFLKRSNFPNVYPIKSKNNKYIEIVENEMDTYYAVVFNEADGINLDINNMSEVQFQCWGRSLASLHSLSKVFAPKCHTRNSWKEILKFTRDILTDFPSEKSAMEELARVEGWLNSLPVTDENYGLIHYDFELDNIFFNKKSDEFYVIDFDSAMYHWYAMDIARTLSDLHELEDLKAENGLQHFMKGYRSIIHIDESYMSLLPRFQRFDNLFTFAKLLRSLQDSNFLQEPDWLQKLRPKLLKKCAEYRESFEKAW